MIAALAALNQLKRKVARVETKALDQLVSLVGAERFRLERIEVMGNPESRIIAVGTSYRAKMFIAASSSSAEPVC